MSGSGVVTSGCTVPLDTARGGLYAPPPMSTGFRDVETPVTRKRGDGMGAIAPLGGRSPSPPVAAP